MYVPANFKVEDPKLIREFLAQYPFATLLQGFEASHIPLLELDTPTDPSARLHKLYGHLTASNTLVQKLRSSGPDAEVMAIFLGPHAYISSSWYSNPNIPPTWNFMSAHLRGSARIIDDEARTWEIVQATVSWAEAHNRTAWSISGEHPAIKPLRQLIVGVELEVRDLQCSFKLSQNRSRSDQENVIRELRGKGQGDLASWMEKVLFQSSPRSSGEST
ncbi:MAG TPA: FMN-binding negative transcriptional regulator [Pseudobdellovibrionaceae bacterium]|nr:FMN-binding negative transcriptional regulator [Pseudobdellovibrionaceae bacterium]